MVELAVLRLTPAKHGGGTSCCWHVMEVGTVAMEDSVYGVEAPGGSVAVGGNGGVIIRV